jgi:hypothetical protein
LPAGSRRKHLAELRLARLVASNQALVHVIVANELNSEPWYRYADFCWC